MSPSNRIKPKFKINPVFVNIMQDIWNGCGIVALITGIVATVIMLISNFHAGMG